MALGLMIMIARFIIDIFAAAQIGGVDPVAIANPASGSAADTGVARSRAARLPGLRFVAIATLVTSVVLMLVTIRHVLGFQAKRVDEIAQRSRLRAAA